MAYERFILPENVGQENISGYMAKISQSFDGAAGKTAKSAKICSYNIDEHAGGEAVVVCAKIKGQMTNNQAGVIANYRVR